MADKTPYGYSASANTSCPVDEDGVYDNSQTITASGGGECYLPYGGTLSVSADGSASAACNGVAVSVSESTETVSAAVPASSVVLTVIWAASNSSGPGWANIVVEANMSSEEESEPEDSSEPEDDDDDEPTSDSGGTSSSSSEESEEESSSEGGSSSEEESEPESSEPESSEPDDGDPTGGGSSEDSSEPESEHEDSSEPEESEPEGSEPEGSGPEENEPLGDWDVLIEDESSVEEDEDEETSGTDVSPEPDEDEEVGDTVIPRIIGGIYYGEVPIVSVWREDNIVNVINTEITEANVVDGVTLELNFIR